MVKKEYYIANMAGIHVQNANEIVHLLSPFKCQMVFSVPLYNRQANPKSIISLIALGLAHGTTFTVEMNGVDEQKALNTLESYLLRQEIISKSV